MAAQEEKEEKAAHVVRGTTSEANDNQVAHDVLRLAEMGYQQEMSRKFSPLSVLALGFSLTNSWFGLSFSLATGISSGGPVVLIYGLMITATISLAVAISLAELASAYPNSGGQYFWAKVLAPPKYAPIASYLTGWFSFAGSIFTSASIALGMASGIVGLYQLTHPDFVIEAWHVVVTYELFIFFCYFLNTWGKGLPALNKASLYMSLAAFITILIAVPASSPTHQSSRFVFTEFINNTGWEAQGVAFLIGLINANYPFAALDCATHIAEEVKNPERAIPISLLGTVAIGFTTAWTFVISMMFSIQDLDSVLNTPTLVPIIEIFSQAMGTTGAIALETLIILTGVGCLATCHTWQARLCWSFSRDNGLPFSSHLSKVNQTLDVPLVAHTVGVVLNALTGLLYLGSSVAFNSLVGATIALLYISYSIPVACQLFRGREKTQRGPFWFGHVGFISNIILLIWTAYSVIIYALPAVMPVEAGNMNYVCAVYVLIFLVVMLDWLLRGRKTYKGSAHEPVLDGVPMA
ncbi:unnamed protein product [Clonostachys solani]|uniref:Choline transport protein n=1 Tax=Clonostachys solani TaxID=160281 RepID=A0A9N9ZI09_9HYPO|nr:unnamed protein product [Clonostachys solani]